MRIAPTVGTLIWLAFAVSVVGQARPDFSGKWTEIGAPAGQPATVMTVSQNVSSITIETASPGGTLRWTLKLDGTESKNVTTQGHPATQIEQISTAAWDGSKLVIVMPVQSNSEGSYLIKQAWSLEAGKLVVAVTETSQLTGVTLREFRMTYSR